jgi:hypothetical protein
MRSTKYVFGILTVILLIIGIYLKIADASVSGAYVGRYSGWHHYTDTAPSVFFYAGLMAAFMILVIWAQKKDK